MKSAPRSALPTLLFLLCSAVQTRCSSPTPVADASIDLGPTDGSAIVDPTLEVGTGQSAWESLADGDSVELIHGPQGGYHLFARIREQRLGSDVQVTFRVTPAEGGDPINDVTDRIRLIEGRGLLRTSQGWESTSALLVILVRIQGPSEVVGRRYVLEANVVRTGSTVPTSVHRAITIVDET